MPVTVTITDFNDVTARGTYELTVTITDIPFRATGYAASTTEPVEGGTANTGTETDTTAETAA